MEAMVIGPEGEAWDAVFVAEYPNSGAFMAMVTDPAYRKAVVHRQADVATSRLIRCAPGSADTGGFGQVFKERGRACVSLRDRLRPLKPYRFTTLSYCFFARHQLLRWIE